MEDFNHWKDGHRKKNHLRVERGAEDFLELCKTANQDEILALEYALNVSSDKIDRITRQDGQEKVGSLLCRASGRSKLAVLIGSEFRNSVFLIAIMQFCKLPPRMAMRPVFCSGIFQRIELSVMG